MGFWRKYFYDKYPETGTDKSILLKRASWSRGNLDNISSVLLSNDKRSIFVSAPNTEWYQFDRYLLDTGIGKPIRIYRTIQFLIEKHHINKALYYNKDGNRFDLSDKCLLLTPYLFEITKEFLDLWVTILLYENYIKICISPKGKVKWEQVNILIR